MKHWVPGLLCHISWDEWRHMLRKPLYWQHSLLFLLCTATLTNKFPAGELHGHSLCKILQAILYNPYFYCQKRKMTFPIYLSRRMVSHTLMSHKGSYCNALMHSQTQWVCRPKSHFLLGEVSHCNKAGRGSQGRISTPGQYKWSVMFSLFLSRFSPNTIVLFCIQL